MTDNKPFLKVEDFPLSISFFKKQKDDGKTYCNASIQRSYKDKNGEWQREKINLFPDDLLKMMSLSFRAYNIFVEEKGKGKEQQAETTASEYVAQKDGEDIVDFIPF